MQLSVKEHGDDWIALQCYKSSDDAPEDVFEKGFRLDELAYDEPELAFSVIKDVVSRYAESDLFTEGQTGAKQVLGMLGAGPLETLLGENGDRVIADVEVEARADRRFFWTLACVWQNGMSDELWARVQRIVGGFVP
ncbi:DUF6869 domain-containing protein [Sphingomonas corticis]|jgi:hypothetical protein|uniref:DUF6869 domain-containing protein n=1 Tax=Sphingomonas corticis TaxID=2722791 RepID=A0ABX1CM22_9SPHN|nr:hypothetical protein [Sphingomonas corticis]NJR77978.1 hypothetical protein [Sphingomonas corticis]